MDEARTEMACPLCGAKGIWEAKIRQFNYYRCPECDLTFVPANEHLPPDQEKARYELHQNSLDDAGYVNMFTSKFPILRQYCVGMKTILDYGCGPTPVLVELLRREGYYAEGYDPFFAPHLDLTRRYDGVISTEVFEHFACPQKELRTISQLLGPGGYLAVMTKFRQEDVPLDKWWYVHDPTHVAFYSQKTWQWIAQAFGFAILYSNGKDFIVAKKIEQ